MVRLGFYVENYIIGGSERYLVDLILGLDRRRYEIILFSNPNPAFTRYLTQRDLDDIPHRVIPILPPAPYLAVRWVNQTLRRVNQTDQHSQHRKTSQDQRKMKEIINGLWRYAMAGPNMALLAAAYRSRPIDILHIVNGGYPASETCRLAVLVASLAKIPACVMTVHSPAAPLVWPNVLERALDKLVAERLAKIITSARSTAYSLQEIRGMPASKLHPIDLGINVPPCDSISPPDDIRRRLGIPLTAIVVGIVGRFDWYKGHRYLLEAGRMVMDSAEGDDLYLLFVGEGDELSAMKALAGALGIADRAVFTGFYPDALVAMRACDIMTMLSVSNESQGYVTLEAMLQAKPVIASNVCGLGEVVADGETGLLVGPADSQALAAAICELIRNKPLRLSMGEAGRRRFEKKFTLDRMIASTQAVYEELLAWKRCP